MSLFQNIFQPSQAGVGSKLFGQDNKFKATPVDAVPGDAAEPAEFEPRARKGNKDRKLATAEEPLELPVAKKQKKDKQKAISTAEEEQPLPKAKPRKLVHTIEQPENPVHSKARSTPDKPSQTHSEPLPAPTLDKKKKRSKASASISTETAEVDEAVGRAMRVATKLSSTNSKVVATSVKQVKDIAVDADNTAADETDKAEKKKLKRKRKQADESEEPLISEAVPTEPAAPSTDADAAKERAEQNARKLQRTIFVGNLPASIKRKKLTQLFTKYGKVESVRLRSVPTKLGGKIIPRRAAVVTGQIDAERGPAHAYVVFEEADTVEAALAANMSEVEGHHIRVDAASAPASQRDTKAPAAYDPLRSVFVGNLHFQVKDEEVVQFFSTGLRREPAELVEAVRIVRDSATNIGKGFAFVLFKTKESARSALALNGQPLRKRPLRVLRSSKASVGHDSARTNRPTSVTVGHGKHRQELQPSDWQGTVTKGKGFKLRTASSKQRPTGPGSTASTPVNRPRPDKRPAVAERKAKTLAKAGRSAAAARELSSRPAQPAAGGRGEMGFASRGEGFASRGGGFTSRGGGFASRGGGGFAGRGDRGEGFAGRGGGGFAGRGSMSGGFSSRGGGGGFAGRGGTSGGFAGRGGGGFASRGGMSGGFAGRGGGGFASRGGMRGGFASRGGGGFAGRGGRGAGFASRGRGGFGDRGSRGGGGRGMGRGGYGSPGGFGPNKRQRTE